MPDPRSVDDVLATMPPDPQVHEGEDLARLIEDNRLLGAEVVRLRERLAEVETAGRLFVDSVHRMRITGSRVTPFVALAQGELRSLLGGGGR